MIDLMTEILGSAADRKSAAELYALLVERGGTLELRGTTLGGPRKSSSPILLGGGLSQIAIGMCQATYEFSDILSRGSCM